MLLIPVRTPLLHNGDDLAGTLYKDGKIIAGDIVVISAKAIATTEGNSIDAKKTEASPEAKSLSTKIIRSPQFCEALLAELQRLHGSIIGTCPGAALTEVSPVGLATGTILVANAGLDESNAPEGFVIGWPADPVESANRLRASFEKRLNTKNEQQFVAVIITDSCCHPRRLGVTAFALTASGIDPLQSQKGRKDLFGKPLHITTEAIADQLATAANFLMGNAEQSTPAVIIRDHGLTLSEWTGWVPGIEAEEDLFKGMFSQDE